MRQIDISYIKAYCVRHASDNEMVIETLNNETYRARGNDQIIDVPLSHLYTQLQNGWEVMETLQNETCYDGLD